MTGWIDVEEELPKPGAFVLLRIERAYGSGSGLDGLKEKPTWDIGLLHRYRIRMASPSQAPLHLHRNSLGTADSNNRG